MLVIVVLGLSISLLILLGVFVFALLDVAFAGPQGLPAARLRTWQPPLAANDQLLTWAANVAKTTTLRWLSAARTQDSTRQLAKEIHEGSTYAIAQSPRAVVQTKPKCASCRHQRIGLTALETLTIADEILRTKPQREVQRIRRQAMQNAGIVAQRNDHPLEQVAIVCPLLDHNSCVVFDFRPLQCRGWCRFSGEDGDRCRLPTGEVVGLDLHAYTVGQGAENGLSQGLASAGLDGTVYELNSALSTALETPNAAQHWAEGKPVFAGCRPYEETTHLPL